MTPDSLVYRALVALATTVLLVTATGARADRMDSYRIGDSGQAKVRLPDWFKDSFLDLREDLSEARESGKRGIIVYLGQENCSHCQALMDTTFSDGGTKARVQADYDVIGLDIFSDLELTDIEGTGLTVKEFAENKGARFTPTLLFYGVEPSLSLKIVGFYPPEKFNRVLDFIDGEHYRSQTLADYLRADGVNASATPGITYDYSLFSEPPHDLRRGVQSVGKPTLVVFETADCGPCSRFHERVLGDAEVRRLLTEFEAVQLDAADELTSVTTPGGKTVTPSQWFEALGLGYDITVVFFNEEGDEAHRIDSETGRDRFLGSMQFVLEEGYKQHAVYQRWRRQRLQQE